MTCTATSTMNVGPKAGGAYPWTLTLTATSNTNPFRLEGYATARGNDQQYVQLPGLFASMVSLGARKQSLRLRSCHCLCLLP